MPRYLSAPMFALQHLECPAHSEITRVWYRSNRRFSLRALVHHFLDYNTSASCNTLLKIAEKPLTEGNSLFKYIHCWLFNFIHNKYLICRCYVNYRLLP